MKHAVRHSIHTAVHCEAGGLAQPWGGVVR